MNALVGYGSSDEEEEVKPTRPSKAAKIEPSAKQEDQDLRTIATQTQTHRTKSTNLLSKAQAPASAPAPAPAPAPEAVPTQEISGPAPGPSRIAADENTVLPPDTDTVPFSPYTFERQRLRELTMPTVPSFDIPDSPPPPTRNSEEAATLAATTKKFEHFLELKKQGTHFNERLQSSSSLRNPSLLPKLMDFAGISAQASYESTLPDELAVPSSWPDECYVDSLLRQNERREKRRLAEREKLDFVPASKSTHRDNASTTGRGSNGERKSKFDA